MQVVKWMDRSMQKARRADGSWVPNAYGGQQPGYGAPGEGCGHQHCAAGMLFAAFLQLMQTVIGRWSVSCIQSADLILHCASAARGCWC
jgi:hypothetical protein